MEAEPDSLLAVDEGVLDPVALVVDEWGVAGLTGELRGLLSATELAVDGPI